MNRIKVLNWILVGLIFVLGFGWYSTKANLSEALTQTEYLTMEANLKTDSLRAMQEADTLGNFNLLQQREFYRYKATSYFRLTAAMLQVNANIPPYVDEVIKKMNEINQQAFVYGFPVESDSLADKVIKFQVKGE